MYSLMWEGLLVTVICGVLMSRALDGNTIPHLDATVGNQSGVSTQPQIPDTWKMTKMPSETEAYGRSCRGNCACG